MELRLAMLGCGNVGKAFIALLAEKGEELRARYDLRLRFTGGLTRSAGGWLAPDGISADTLARSVWPSLDAVPPPGAERFVGTPLGFAATCPANVLLELTTLAPMTGQPASDYVRAALDTGRHVVTANKGPISYYYRVLRVLAEERGVQLRFESTVMDGTPIFNLAEFALPATEVMGFRGVLNATSNFVLATMANGSTLEEAVREAQRLGIAEADPAYDLDGWDASVKATVLARVLMGANLRPPDVRREGLGADAMRAAQLALTPGHALKQVVEARRMPEGDVAATVTLQALPVSDPLALLQAGETAVTLHTDTMGDLTLIEGAGGPERTAFGVLADIITIARTARQTPA